MDTLAEIELQASRRYLHALVVGDVPEERASFKLYDKICIIMNQFHGVANKLILLTQSCLDKIKPYIQGNRTA